MARVHRRRVLQVGVLVGSIAGVLVPVAACGDPYAAEATPTTEEASTAPDSGVEATATPDPCVHAAPLGPPALDDDPAKELAPFFLGIRDVVLSDAKDVLGFDLDGVCSCDTRPATARAGAPSCAVAASPRCDQDGGIDNAIALLAAELSPFFALDAVPQKLITSGRRTLLIQIGKYNGRANDKEIAVGLALSDGIREEGGCPTSVENTKKGIWSPGWCGDDRWSFLTESVIPGTTQPLLQGVGYVRDGILTITLPGSLPLPFNDSQALPLGSAVVTGALVPLGKDMKPRDPAREPLAEELRLWAIDKAVIGGRVKATDLLAALGTIERNGTGDAGSTFLCQEGTFALARQGVCDAVDITSTRALDFDPGARCDALSMGLSFTAYPILPGTVRPTSADGNPCKPGANGQPAGNDDAPYSCVTPK